MPDRNLPKSIKNSNNNKKPKNGGTAKIAAPLAQTRLYRGQNPSISGSKYSSDGRTKFRHREYVADILGSATYSVTSYPINPGLAQMFLWLSTEAFGFESYEFSNLSFEFETQKSASTNGSVMMAVDFDASDSAPVNKQQLMSYHNSVRAPVWAECIYDCDHKDLKKFGPQRYLRFGSIPSTDIKTYDIGNLYVATQGCLDATAIGELYVCYDVNLITPQTDYSQQFAAASARVASGGTVSDTAIYGDAPVITGGLPVSAAANTLTFNKVGQYLLEINVVGTGLAAGTPGLTGTATSSLLAGMAVNGTVGGIVIYRVQVNNNGETVITDFSALATTITSSVARIGSYLYSLA